MTDQDDFGSAGYDRVTGGCLTGVITAIHDRPGDALMLMKEAYAIYLDLLAFFRLFSTKDQAARRDVPR